MKARFCGKPLLWKSEVVKTSREGPLSTRRSGRRGIRTPGTQIRVRQFSKLVVSATHPSFPLTHPSKPISLKEWCKCREKKLLYKIIGAKNCGSACRRPKSLFCGIVPLCRRAVGSADGARCVQMSFAGHLHAVYPENGIMVFSVWDASRLSQI